MGIDERKLIEAVFAPLARGAKGAFGLTDDAALLPVNDGKDHIVTLDTLVEGVHFRPGDPPELIARKALRINISDIAAKGATPFAWFLSLALARSTSEDWVSRFASGLAEDQKKYGLDLYGGDTVRSPHGIVVSVTMVGRCQKKTSVRRSGARPGDRVYVSGTIGDAALGLPAGGNEGLAGCDAADLQWLNQRFWLPDPPFRLAGAVGTFASAAMDISDGLVNDLGLLCRASGVGAEIDITAVPLSGPAARALAEQPDRLADILAGGDDYEILAVVPAEKADAFELAAAQVDETVTSVGYIVAESIGVRFFNRDGKTVNLPQTTFRHF